MNEKKAKTKNVVRVNKTLGRWKERTKRSHPGKRDAAVVVHCSENSNKTKDTCAHPHLPQPAYSPGTTM